LQGCSSPGPDANGGPPAGHVEDVSGLLFPLFRAFMGGAIRRHHEGLNDAVKERAEGHREAVLTSSARGVT